MTQDSNDQSSKNHEDNAFTHRLRPRLHQPIFYETDVRKAAAALAEAPLDASVEDDARLVLETVCARAVDPWSDPDILRGRLEDAEAKVAQARTLLDEGEMIWPDAPEWAVDGVREFTERIRVALDGNA